MSLLLGKPPHRCLHYGECNDPIGDTPHFFTEPMIMGGREVTKHSRQLPNIEESSPI